MTDGNASRNAIRSARRRQRYAARAVLWRRSSLSRVRACGLNVQGTHHDPRSGRQEAREAVVRLRVAVDAVDGRKASWGGVQSCGSTWACPVCSERIQSARNAEVGAALAVAKLRGWVVGFLTFTVRHKRRHSLAEVWGAVGKAWRAATSGASYAWEADKIRYGIRGYLRLTEVTHGDNGWHVHIHALLFLDPQGLTRPVKVRAHGPEHYRYPTAALSTGALGPLTQDEARRAVAILPDGLEVPGQGSPWFIGPVTEDEDRRRTTLPPLVVVDAAPVEHLTNCKPSKGCVCPTPEAVLNRDYFDTTVAPVRGLYLRDVERLGESMGARWAAALEDSEFEPDGHGHDARLVTGEGDLAAYFAKNVYAVRTTRAAAAEVTSSFAKEGRRGNVTPFGILARIAAAPERVDPATGELIAEPSPVDLALWYEWEQVSKGKRQLLWSNGLRDLLGLDPEASDDQAANEDQPGRDLLELDRKAYRRIARAGLGPEVLGAAEHSEGAVEHLLRRHGIPFTFVRPEARAARAVEVWASIGYTVEEPPPN